jgi:hypothetical protein
MIIDSHIHIFPREVRSDRRTYSLDEPEFEASYGDESAKQVGASETVAMMDEQGIDRAMVFGFPWRKDGHMRMNNDYVLDAAGRYPDRLIPFCCCDPGHPRAAQEVERCLARGARGVGESAFYITGMDERAEELFREITGLCREAGCPIILHFREPLEHHRPGRNPSLMHHLSRLLKAYPETRWVLAHMGGGLPFFGFLNREESRLLRNCWFDTAGLPFFLSSRAFQALAASIGMNGIIYGSDYPRMAPERYFREIAKASFSDGDKAAILGGNAEALLSAG